MRDFELGAPIDLSHLADDVLQNCHFQHGLSRQSVAQKIITNDPVFYFFPNRVKIFLHRNQISQAQLLFLHIVRIFYITLNYTVNLIGPCYLKHCLRYFGKMGQNAQKSP